VSVLYRVCDFTRETDLSAIKFLLDHGADPTIACKGKTPLEVCLARGRVDIAKLLMKYGATIPSSDECVWDAYDNDQEDVLKFLVANGKRVYPQMLLECVQDGDIEGVRMLLACGACPNTVVEGKPIIFHIHRINAGKAEIVRMLCDAGADVHAKTAIGLFNTHSLLLETSMQTFLYEMVYEYVNRKNEHTFTVIKTLIARGAKPPPLEMYNTMPAFKKNPVDYMQMNVLFMKARWAAKTAKV
jgi:ankyrin repeat protein